MDFFLQGEQIESENPICSLWTQACGFVRKHYPEEFHCIEGWRWRRRSLDKFSSVCEGGGERLWYAASTAMMKNDSGALSNSLITCFWSLSYLPSDWNQTGDGKGFHEWLWALPAAGLRPSKACNVRRPDSALGPGMRFEMRDGQIVNVIIDLREEKNLRADLINVGGIKKPREQKVYPACFFRNMQSARIFYIFFHSNLKRVSWAFQVWRSEKHFERYITCCLWTYFLSFDILWENILSACGKVGWNKADYHIRQS